MGDRIEDLIKAHLNKDVSKEKLVRRKDCPDEVLLAGYLRKELSGPDMDKAEAHISTCYFCLEKLSIAHEAERLYKEESLPDSPKRMVERAKAIAPAKGSSKMRPLWFAGFIASFVLSFFIHRYFMQFLILALILGLKWALETDNARTFIMVMDSWRKGSHDKDGEISSRLHSHLSK